VIFIKSYFPEQASNDDNYFGLKLDRKNKKAGDLIRTPAFLRLEFIRLDQSKYISVSSSVYPHDRPTFFQPFTVRWPLLEPVFDLSPSKPSTTE